MLHDVLHDVLHEIRLFCIALQFLTRVPVPAWVGYRDDWMHASARHYPAVGLVVGGVGAAVLWAGAHWWPAAVAVGLSMAATVWLTGAFHEDGLADTCDALGGNVSRERALLIMKDSRLGSYGTIGLLAVLGLKAAVLLGLALRNFELVLIALPLAHAWSRVVPVLLLRWLDYAGDAEHAKAKPMAQQASDTTLWMVAAWTLIVGAAAAWCGLSLERLVAAAAAALLVALWMARWLRRRLGGYTGDTLGAAQQGAELSIYLALLAQP